MTIAPLSTCSLFQSMRPARGATFTASGSFSAGIFQSTRPVRGATRLQRGEITGDQAFQSTRPMRGATVGDQVRPQSELISIHAPLAGCDLGLEVPINRHGISIHAPHAGRDFSQISCWAISFRFQSTRPMRGATRMMMAERGVFSFQSTRPMRGATYRRFSADLGAAISIHAPHAGRDCCCARCGVMLAAFQSTRPVRGATGLAAGRR